MIYLDCFETGVIILVIYILILLLLYPSESDQEKDYSRKRFVTSLQEQNSSIFSNTNLLNFHLHDVDLELVLQIELVTKLVAKKCEEIV